MAKHIKPSVLPIYLVGVVWLGYALLFPLKSAASYGICAVLSLVAFIAGKAVFPDKAFELAGEKEDRPKEEPKKEKTTGDPAIDALIRERDRALSEMRRLNDAIVDEKISAQIDHLEDVTGKIIDQVVSQPKKLSQIRRFMDYYLPTTLKILNAYSPKNCPRSADIWTTTFPRHRRTGTLLIGWTPPASLGTISAPPKPRWSA